MQPVKYGIVGFGQISQVAHVPELLSIPEAEIVAVATTDPEKHERIRSTIGSEVRIYPSCRTLLEDPEVEAVVIATPNWLHREQAVAGAGVG